MVTPSGWASLAGDWSGTQPALPASDPTGEENRAVQQASAVQEAEQILTDASLALLTPRSHECLLCYVHRMLLEFGCDGRLRFAAHFRDTRAPRATAMERRLGEVHGLCDCGIFRNGYDLRPEHCIPEVVHETDGVTYVEEYRWPTPLPACLGVRSGSTQGCRLWWRRLHW
ncbi:MAG: DUF2695 domain-containing protein [Micropruina sp.]|nr:DUF2695 domain-containing protein [Micropruina sp.]